jgi:hypothetical protein
VTDISLPPPTEPLADPETGKISELWYRYLSRVNTAVNNVEVADAREQLTATETIYVRTDGSDSNDGTANDAAHAFLTIQAAVTHAAKSFDAGALFATPAIIVKVADGTYNESVELWPIVGATNGGNIQLVGNTTTPTACIVSGVGTHTIYAIGAGTDWLVKGFHLQSTVAGMGAVNGHAEGWIRLSDVQMGPVGAGAAIMTADFGGTVEIQGPLTISTGAYNTAVYTHTQGRFVLTANAAVTVSTPSTYTFFATCQQAGIQYWIAAAPFNSTGAVGSRYYADTKGCIFTGGTTTYFPGSSTGTGATDGQYNGTVYP